MLIVFSGMAGTGKSALSEQVAHRLRIPVFSVDRIESAILAAGLVRSFETGLASYHVVESLSDLQLSLGQSVIVDAVNAEEEAKSMWRGLASKHGATMRIVECRCSDEALHRQRLQSRYRPWSGIPEPTWGQVQERRRAWSAWKEPAFLVDSTNSLEDNLEEVLRWLGV